MADLLKTEVLALFLFFAVPGYVAFKVYDLLVPAERRNFAESAIEVVSVSLFNLALFFPLVAKVNDPSFAQQHPFVHYLAFLFVIFVAPGMLAVAARWLLTQPFLRGKTVHPTPTGWDFYFGKGSAPGSCST